MAGENDWSSRQVRLKVELTAISVAMLLVFHYFDPSEPVSVLSFELNGVPHSHLVIFLYLLWTYISMALIIRTFDEVPQVDFSRNRMVRFRDVQNRLANVTASLTMGLRRVLDPEGLPMGSQTATSLREVQNGATKIHQEIFVLADLVTSNDDAAWRKQLRLLEVKLKSLENEAMSIGREDPDRVSHGVSPGSSLIVSSFKDLNKAAEFLLKQTAGRARLRTMERLGISFLAPLLFAVLVAGSGLPELTVSAREVWHDLPWMQEAKVDPPTAPAAQPGEPAAPVDGQ